MKSLSRNNQSLPASITLNHVGFSYADRPILGDISLVVPQGKTVAIMGSSGTGKTTLIRLIAGLIQASYGQVLYGNQDISLMTRNQLHDFRRNMGILFQFGALLTDLNVFENVAFPLREHTDLPDDIIRDIVTLKLHVVGLRGTQSLMPSELSGGMAKRVALARAIVLDPVLMLYDEPFTGLDPISLGVIAHLIKHLQQALGMTAIIVTHDVAQSLNIVDYVYFIANGMVVAQGTPEEVYKSESPWLQQFIKGQPDGPVHFAYPTTETLAEALAQWAY